MRELTDSEVIYAYTRAQALDDGILVDTTALAKEAGFKWPVAVTTRLWHGYIVPALDLVPDGQSINGRLWDLLTVLHYTILNSKDETFLRFSVLFLMSPGSITYPRRAYLYCRSRRRRRARDHGHAPRRGLAEGVCYEVLPD